MDKSAFELYKNNARTNTASRLHNTPLIEYARVIEVIDVKTVRAETVVRTSSLREVFTVNLLSLSSALLEVSDYPKLGDTVLLLFVRRYSPLMFMNETVHDPDAAGYNRFSGVGILMSTVKNKAKTLISCYEDGDGKAVAEINSEAEVYGAFTNLVTLEFCRASFDSSDEALISILFGEGRPFTVKHLSGVTREHGFWEDNEGALIPLDAPVVERYSEHSPVTKDIQGAQTVSVGIGKDGDTDAPVNITLGGKADVTLSSASALTMSFEKAILVQSGDTFTLEITGGITLASEDKISVTASGNVAIEAGGDVEVKAAGKVHIGNDAYDLLSLMKDFIAKIKAAKTFGPPGQHVLESSTVAVFTAFEAQIETLLQ